LQQRINNRGYSIVGVFLLGAISTLILSPCVTAPLAGALVYISNSHNLIIGGAALFMLGMGIGTPLLFISVVGNQFLPKSGKWMVSVKQFLGMIMLLLALYPLYPYIAFTWVLGIIGMWLIIVSFFIASFFRHRALRILFVTVIFGLGGMLIVSPRAKRIINASTVATTVFNLKVTDATALQSILYLAQAQHKIVVLDFSANWCLACTEMDLTTWRDATLHKLMQDTVNVKIDVTENNSNSLELEKMYHVFAPPAVIIIDQSGNVVRQFMGNIMASPMVKELQQLLGH